MADTQAVVKKVAKVLGAVHIALCTPLLYARDGEALVVAASNAGKGLGAVVVAQPSDEP